MEGFIIKLDMDGWASCKDCWCPKLSTSPCLKHLYAPSTDSTEFATPKQQMRLSTGGEAKRMQSVRFLWLLLETWPNHTKSTLVPLLNVVSHDGPELQEDHEKSVCRTTSSRTTFPHDKLPSQVTKMLMMPPKLSTEKVDILWWSCNDALTRLWITLVGSCSVVSTWCVTTYHYLFERCLEQ